MKNDCGFKTPGIYSIPFNCGSTLDKMGAGLRVGSMSTISTTSEISCCRAQYKPESPHSLMTLLAMKFGHTEHRIGDTVEIEHHLDNMNMEGPLRKTDSHFIANPSPVLFVTMGLPPHELL
jgi:hypothetical protein